MMVTNMAMNPYRTAILKFAIGPVSDIQIAFLIYADALSMKFVFFAVLAYLLHSFFVFCVLAVFIHAHEAD